MAIKNRTQLKAEFVSGTAATAAKFEDIFDSHFNKYEDSVLAGPIGETGTNGLVGPSGSTFYNGLLGPEGATFYKGLLGPEGATYFIGLWLDTVSSGPSGSTSSGSTGQVIIADEFVYICRSENNWIRITGSTSF
jgi:hypothetical protein